MTCGLKNSPDVQPRAPQNADAQSLEPRIKFAFHEPYLASAAITR